MMHDIAGSVANGSAIDLLHTVHASMNHSFMRMLLDHVQ